MSGTGDRDWGKHRERMSADLALDPARTAVLTIDMQRAYLDPSIGSSKCLDPDEARAVVDASCRLLAGARELGVPVIHAYVNRLPVELEARLGNSRFATISKDLRSGGAPQPPDRPIGSVEAELVPGLDASGDVHIRSKKTSDSYYGTELAILLEGAIRPSTLVLLGINTETCVYATTFATKVRGYQPVVASDCVGSHRDPDNSRLALELMSRTIAWTLPTDAILAKLRA